MANLRKCTRCKSEIDISYCGMSRKKEPYKTCDNCRTKKIKQFKHHQILKKTQQHQKHNL